MCSHHWMRALAGGDQRLLGEGADAERGSPVTHNRFGASRVNIRSTRSTAVGVSCRGLGRRAPSIP